MLGVALTVSHGGVLHGVQGSQVVQVIQGWTLVRVVARKQDVRLIGTLQGRNNTGWLQTTVHEARASEVAATTQLSTELGYVPAKRGRRPRIS